MTTLLVDLNEEISKPYLDYVQLKIKTINKYLDNNQLPDANDPFIEKSKCYFCLYQRICDLK